MARYSSDPLKRIVDLTVGELEIIISETVKNNLIQQSSSLPIIQKEFYSPKEFSHKTGIPYSTVIYRCKFGKLKARQDDHNCSWQIFASELERYKDEASENTN